MSNEPTLTEPAGRERVDPQDIAVQLNVKVPWHYREQLIRQAAEANLSLNRFVVNGLVRCYPPERK
jgi:predicted HicB family RNase H-like nuclease